jgi:hypothetical protein
VLKRNQSAAHWAMAKYSTDKILSASEDNSFLEWSLTEMELWLGTNRDGVI